MFCDMAEEHAQKHWDAFPLYSARYLRGETRLKFMGDQGCLIPPHLRPSCSLHQCMINSLGFMLHEPAWTRKYFELREKIDELELKRYEEKQ